MRWVQRDVRGRSCTEVAVDGVLGVSDHCRESLDLPLADHPSRVRWTLPKHVESAHDGLLSVHRVVGALDGVEDVSELAVEHRPTALGELRMQRGPGPVRPIGHVAAIVHITGRTSRSQRLSLAESGERNEIAFVEWHLSRSPPVRVVLVHAPYENSDRSLANRPLACVSKGRRRSENDGSPSALHPSESDVSPFRHQEHVRKAARRDHEGVSFSRRPAPDGSPPSG